MTATDVKALVRRYIDQVWNRADLAALDDLTVPGFLYHLAGQPARDRAAMSQFVRSTHAAFPDWRVDIAELIADGERVAVRWDGQATHQGSFVGIAPTGRRIAVSGINVYEIQDDKIAAEWEQTDSLGMLQQLGVLPTAGRA